MSTALLKEINLSPDRPELVAQHFAPELIVTPDDNPVYSPAMLADLLPSMREHGQLVPGWVYPSEDLPDNQRICLEGNRRLTVARLLGIPFWAFDLGRFVSEHERIELLFHHHQSRRVMSRDEIAQRASRYMELTGCTATEAAKHLNISGPTLSRAFGEQRILPELRARAEQLGPTIRSVIAAARPDYMVQALEFAETALPSGKKPSRDQVVRFIEQIKDKKRPKAARPKRLKFRIEDRRFEIELKPGDGAETLIEAFKAVASRLQRHRELPLEAVAAILADTGHPAG